MDNSNNNFEKERIVNIKEIEPFLELLICKICYCVPYSPKKCTICNNIFCVECSNNLKDKQCPFKCSNQVSFVDIDNHIKRFFDVIILKCKNSQCTEVCHYLEIIAHEQKCAYSMCMCKNKKCQKVLPVGEILSHYLICDFTKLQCPECNLLFEKSSFLTHTCGVISQDGIMYVNNTTPATRHFNILSGIIFGDDARFSVKLHVKKIKCLRIGFTGNPRKVASDAFEMSDGNGDSPKNAEIYYIHLDGLGFYSNGTWEDLTGSFEAPYSLEIVWNNFTVEFIISRKTVTTKTLPRGVYSLLVHSRYHQDIVDILGISPF